jgi:hypothetical protein
MNQNMTRLKVFLNGKEIVTLSTQDKGLLRAALGSRDLLRRLEQAADEIAVTPQECKSLSDCLWMKWKQLARLSVRKHLAWTMKVQADHERCSDRVGDLACIFATHSPR